MATVTTERSSRNRLTPEQIAERKQAAAVAELERNGIDVTIPLVPLAPLPPEPRNFQSRPNAKPMAKADVCNVENLSPDDAEALLRRLKLTSPKLYQDLLDAEEGMWGGWEDNDIRWSLTPHELKRPRRRSTVAK